MGSRPPRRHPSHFDYLRSLGDSASRYVRSLTSPIRPCAYIPLPLACVVSASYVPGTGCVADQTKSILLLMTFVWSIFLDATVFLLSAWKILAPGPGRRSRLVDMIFKDGLIYFFVA